MSKRTLVILEAPWENSWDDKSRPLGMSVESFFNGLNSINQNHHVLHSRFYDSSSFEKALNYMTAKDDQRYVIYVAAHGSNSMVHNMKLQNLVKIINGYSQEKEIEGVLFGSCLTGNSKDHYADMLIGGKTKWVFGYKCSVKWFEGTLIDVSIINQLISIRRDAYYSEIGIIKHFSNALSMFSNKHDMGFDQRDEAVNLGIDSVTLVVQPNGQGKKPMDVTDELFDID